MFFKLGQLVGDVIATLKNRGASITRTFRTIFGTHPLLVLCLFGVVCFFWWQESRVVTRICGNLIVAVGNRDGDQNSLVTLSPPQRKRAFGQMPNLQKATSICWSARPYIDDLPVLPD